MSFWDKEKSLTSGGPYELHEFYTGSIEPPDYPVLKIADGPFEVRNTDPNFAHDIPVSTLDDLNNIRNNLTGHYYLTNDIDASDTINWNDGEGFYPIRPGYFTGTLDGCGYTISNLYINNDSAPYSAGLFGLIRSLAGKYGETGISNLILDSPIVIGNDLNTGAAFFCGMAGPYTPGGSVIFHNCHVVNGTITSLDNIGNICCETWSWDNETAYVLFTDCTVNGCTVNLNGTSSQGVGGIVGDSESDQYNNCRVISTSFFSMGGDRYLEIGGLLGYAVHARVTDCAVSGLYIKATGCMGGLIGYDDWDCVFTRCSARGEIQCHPDVDFWVPYVGGLSSDTDGSSYIDCYAWIDIMSDGEGMDSYWGWDTSGLISFTDNGTVVTNCYAKGYLPPSSPELNRESAAISVYAQDSVFTSVFWDEQICGLDKLGIFYDFGGNTGEPEGHTTSWMKTRANFEAAGWDFDNVWQMSEIDESSNAWRYADAPADISYGDNIFKACYITGGRIETGTNAIKSRTTVRCNWNNPFTWQYTIAAPNDIVHYRRYKGHGADVKLIFIGDVVDVQFKQESRQGDRYAEIIIEPPRASLNRMGLIARYSRQCTVELYSEQCGVNRTLYKKSGSLDSVSGNILTSTIFGTESDGWWKGGDIVINSRRPKIIAHSGNDITILPFIYGLAVGDSFDVCPGCNHLIAICHGKFGNRIDMKAQPKLPSRNPFSSEAVRG